jgi:hypothetical protein
VEPGNFERLMELMQDIQEWVLFSVMLYILCPLMEPFDFICLLLQLNLNQLEPCVWTNTQHEQITRYGQPPVEIIKELAPELQFDDEGMPIMDPMGNNGMMPPFMPGMPFPGGDGQQCCIS